VPGPGTGVGPEGCSGNAGAGDRKEGHAVSSVTMTAIANIVRIRIAPLLR